MKTKRIFALLLSLLMVMTMGVTTAFAAGGTEEKGSITINGALKGNTFTLYKIFDLVSYNTEDNTYAYTIRNDSPLYDKIKAMTMKAGSPLQDKPVFAFTSKNVESDYVQLSTYFSNIQPDGTEIKAIAAELMRIIDGDPTDPTNYPGLTDDEKATLSMSQVKNLGVTGETDTSKNEVKLPAAGTTIETTALAGDANKDKYNIVFSNLGLGYYLVDSSAGAMLGLTTTNPDGEINAKNELPSVVKEVKRNVNNTWDDTNSKYIGETVNYRVKVAVREGATNYVIYDSLSEGLTFDKITKVYYGYENNPAESYVIYDASKGTAITDPTVTEYFEFTEATEAAPVTHIDPTTKVEKNCCFKMVFTDEFLNQVLEGTGAGTGYTKTIFVEYDAKLNEKAVIGTVGNPNDVYLTYGENDVDVAHDTVKTTTYEMELVKTKNDKTVLTGAEFEVYTQRTLTTTAAVGLNQTETLTGKLSFVKSTENGKTVYRVATAEEIAAGGTVTTIEAGGVIIRGLGGNFVTDTSGASEGRSYYFKETKAPDGYTLVPTSTEFKIGNKNEPAVVEAGKWVSGGLRIINNSGSLLPSTGGMGTTIFYIVGTVLLVGAGVLLVAKKRMSAAKESK